MKQRIFLALPGIGIVALLFSRYSPIDEFKREDVAEMPTSADALEALKKQLASTPVIFSR